RRGAVRARQQREGHLRRRARSRAGEPARGGRRRRAAAVDAGRRAEALADAGPGRARRAGAAGAAQRGDLLRAARPEPGRPGRARGNGRGVSAALAARQMTLVAFLQAQNCSNYPASWRHAETAGDFLTAEYFQRIARALEDARFHLAFFDDRLAMPDRYGD